MALGFLLNGENATDFGIVKAYGSVWMPVEEIEAGLRVKAETQGEDPCRSGHDSRENMS